MNEDIKNAISPEDPVVHDKIMRAFDAIGDIAAACVVYEEGEISGKVAMDYVVERIVGIEKCGDVQPEED